MVHRRYTVKWNTGDQEKGLSQGEVLKLMEETGSSWVGPDVLRDGDRVGRVIRERDQ